jgi:hypothetical protein
MLFIHISTDGSIKLCSDIVKQHNARHHPRPTAIDDNKSAYRASGACRYQVMPSAFIRISNNALVRGCNFCVCIFRNLVFPTFSFNTAREATSGFSLASDELTLE